MDARNLKVKAGRTSRLGNKNEGPFEISRVVHQGSAYELRLPPALQIHNVFHPWLLHPDRTEEPTEPQDVPVGPELVQREGDDEPVEEWPVEEIVNSRWFNTKLKYKATYRGHHEWNLCPEWQPWEDFIERREKIDDYHHRHPDKAGPWPGFVRPKDLIPPEDRVLAAAITEIEELGDTLYESTAGVEREPQMMEQLDVSDDVAIRESDESEDEYPADVRLLRLAGARADRGGG